MKIKTYEMNFETGKLEEVPDYSNARNNNLPIGAVIYFNGYGDFNQVVIGRLGSQWDGGILYDLVSEKDYSTSRTKAKYLKHISEKKDNRISQYYTDDVRSSDEVLNLVEMARIAKDHRDKEATRKAEARAELKKKLEKDNPDLVLGSDIVVAAKNMRTELKKRFPNVKFSIKSKRYSGGNSIDIRWDNGPTVSAVESITQKYQQGNFNGMEDIYESNHSPWCEVFGGAKYVFENRHVDESIRESIARKIVESYGETFTEASAYYPKIGDLQRMVYAELSELDLTSEVTK